MSVWRPHHYRRLGQEKHIDPDILENAITTGQAISKVNRNLPPVFSLKHLAYLSDTDYGILRSIVCRRFDPYKVFRIRKRSGPHQEKRFRVICVPDPELMRLQRWINHRILSWAKPHQASVAYAKNCNIYDVAEVHCQCWWILKLDIVNFFESISEIRVYRVFRSFGYQPLVAFEMTRLCTRQGADTKSRLRKPWLSTNLRHSSIPDYLQYRMGHLPQGAPTSPMLANLSVCDLDGKLAELADHNRLIYTRYADDLTFSSADRTFGRGRMAAIAHEAYSALVSVGLSPNRTKTKILTPGARKVVLGLLVDHNKPRLSRRFKANLRQHLYYLSHPDIGPAIHAKRRRFVSVIGLRNHVQGLVAFAQQVEPSYGISCKEKLNSVVWPL